MNLKDKLVTMRDKEKIELSASDEMLIKRPVLVLEKEIFIGFKEDKWNILKEKYTKKYKDTPPLISTR